MNSATDQVWHQVMEQPDVQAWSQVWNGTGGGVVVQVRNQMSSQVWNQIRMPRGFVLDQLEQEGS